MKQKSQHRKKRKKRKKGQEGEENIERASRQRPPRPSKASGTESHQAEVTWAKGIVFSNLFPPFQTPPLALVRSCAFGRGFGKRREDIYWMYLFGCAFDAEVNSRKRIYFFIRGHCLCKFLFMFYLLFVLSACQCILWRKWGTHWNTSKEVPGRRRIRRERLGGGRRRKEEGGGLAGEAGP